MRYSLIEKIETDRYRIGFPVFSGSDLERFQEIARTIGTAVLKTMEGSYAAFNEAYLKTNPATHGVPLQEVLDLVYHHTYSLAFGDIITRHPELKFLREDGDLRYTGYARIQ
jgi:hypothetical protein